MADDRPALKATLAAVTDAVGAVSSPAVAALTAAGAVLAGSLLAEREEIRVEQVVRSASDLLVELEAGGETVREDGFFERIDGRCTGDEVIEGVLRAAKGTYEEKKLPHLSHLLARLAFEEKLGRVQSLHLISAAEKLSYTQYQLLELFADPSRFSLATSVHSKPLPSMSPVHTLLADAWELHTAGYVRPDGGGWWLAAIQQIPGNCELVGAGKVLRYLLDLKSLTTHELEPIAMTLTW